MKRKRKIAIAIGFLLATVLATDWALGSFLIAPQPSKVGPPPPELHAETVTVPSASGASLSGWWIRGETGKGAVILLHGVRGNRLSVLDRVEFLRQSGCSVLLFDFQAHGESAGKHITFGLLESRDATAAVAFVKKNAPGERIGVIGVSLGGAAALLAEPALPVNAMVLESVYPSLQQATEDRLAIRLGRAGKLLAPLLTWQLRPRLGFGVDELKPIEHARSNRTPKLFLAGTEDRHTTLAESKELFAAAAEAKELWLVEGAGHIDLHVFARQEYEKRVLNFFQVHLQTGSQTNK